MSGIVKLQLSYFKRLLGVPQFSCGNSILFDLAVTRMDIRIRGERDKIVYKSRCFGPPVISRIREKKNKITFIKDLEFSKLYENGFPRIKKNNNIKKKWQTEVETLVNGVYKSKVITGTRPIDVYGQRLKYIRMHHKAVSAYMCKNIHNEFELCKNNIIIDEADFDDCVGHGTLNDDSWSSFKTNISSLYARRSEKIFKDSRYGKTLKKYNVRWFKDKLLYQLSFDDMDTLIKLRTGTSNLKYHTCISKVDGVRDVFCVHCSGREVEDNYHYFFECPASSRQRGLFMGEVSGILREIGVPLTERSVLGFVPSVSRHSSTRCLQENVVRLYRSICKFITVSGRFRGDMIRAISNPRK